LFTTLFQDAKYIKLLIVFYMRIMPSCVGCAHCEVFCPIGAIKVFGKANIVGNCKECGVCLKFCPQKAIEPNEEM